MAQNQPANILEAFIERENTYADYSISINNIECYPVIRRYIREKYCNSKTKQSFRSPSVDKISVIKNFFLSSIQLVRLLCFGKKKMKNFVYSFYRVDKIGDEYFDKFTDPLIDNSSIKESFVIFEHHKDGVHRKPRKHSKKIVYSDAIDAFGIIYAKLYTPFYKKKHINELERIWMFLDRLMDGVEYNKNSIVSLLVKFEHLSHIYGSIFSRLGVENLIAPARSTFLPLLYAAKKNKIKSFELQHGVLNSVGISFSGHIVEEFTPDYFCSYGEIQQPLYYGIPSNRIVNIGWSLTDYLKNAPVNKDIRVRDVLIPSNPNTTDKVIDVILLLAKKHLDINFYFRPHPVECFSPETLAKIRAQKNVFIQDNFQNFSYVLSWFSNVMGDNSTTLDEALSAGKKVGRLKYDGFVPLYINKEYKEMSWEIYDDESFEAYINAESKVITLESNVYSPFRRKQVEALFG